jgi:hypothetical protein
MKFSTWIKICVVLSWVGAVFWVMSLIGRYEGTPGEAATVPTQWPQNCSIKPNPAKQTLLFFLHPRCACSLASMQEFKHALQHFARTANLSSENIDINCVFTCPDTNYTEWTNTVLVNRAREIPDATIRFDRNGTIINQFHVTTSGHVLLYSKNGKLMYSGGVTLARGHEGNNKNREAFENAMSDSTTSSDECPVFGCKLLDSRETQLGNN